MLKTNIAEFIEERLIESYSKTSQNKKYNNKKKEYLKHESDFITKLEDKKLQGAYENLKNKKYSLDTFELEDAYKTGFKDSANIFMNNNL